MFRSLFVRLLTTFLIILLITLSALSILLTQMYKENYMANMKDEILNESQEINSLTDKKFKNLIGDVTYYTGLSVISKQTNSTIWLVDRVGYVMRVADPNNNNQWEGQQFTKEEFQRYLQQVLNGKEITVTGKFGERFKVPVLTVGTPLIANNQIVGAIFIHTQMDKIQKIYQDLYILIWKSAFVSFVIALILISWTSARISTPLVQMNNIAKEFAKSNFDKRVKVNSRDEIGQLSNSFNSMAEELKKQNEMTKSFVANVSHELRSPLTSMQGFVQGMIDGVIPEDQHQQYLGIVLDETKRLNKLISELLNLAQIESGKFPLKIASFDVNELIRRVLIKYDVKLESKELEVGAAFRDEQCYVDADKDRIEQVVSNLIDNAIKFTPVGGKLTVFTSSVNDKVTISIKDSGPGIKEEDVAYIWDRFYKADKAHTVGSGGTGLGLSIVKKIIEQHDQKIWVESTYGKGSNFIFTLKKSVIKNAALNTANKNL